MIIPNHVGAAEKTRSGRLKPKSNLLDRKNRVGYLFILPVLIGLIFIFLPALYYSFVYSISTVTIRLDAVQLEASGFQNYVDAFTWDTDFRVLMLAAIQRTITDTFVIIIFSFFIATVLNQKFAGRGVVRTIFFLPVLLATGIIASADTNSVMMGVFGSSSNAGSTISSAFTSGGFDVLFSLQDLMESVQINASLKNVILNAVNSSYNTVNSSGVQILIFLAALQSIPPSIFESARVEGATKWEEFWKITFPMITPMIFVNIIYTIVDSFSNPQYGLLRYIQKLAFTDNKIGLASAFSWIYFAIILIILGIVSAIITKRIHYLD